MLTPSLDTFRTFLHVLAASVWVGGQLSLAGVVNVVRREAPHATRSVARGFSKVAWPAFFVTMITGVWNLVAVDVGSTSSSYQATVLVKVTLAVLAGLFAAVHSVGTSKMALAVGGTLGAVCSLGALFVGVMLAG